MSYLYSLLSGLIFGAGLMVSGMYRPQVILDGLRIFSPVFRWDLIITFGAALVTTALFYAIANRLQKPLCAPHVNLPVKSEIDAKLVIGSISFGIGWGLIGLCPGPNVVGLGLYPFVSYWYSFFGMVTGFLGLKYLFRV